MCSCFSESWLRLREFCHDVIHSLYVLILQASLRGQSWCVVWGAPSDWWRDCQRRRESSECSYMHIATVHCGTHIHVLRDGLCPSLHPSLCPPSVHLSVPPSLSPHLSHLLVPPVVPPLYPSICPSLSPSFLSLPLSPPPVPPSVPPSLPLSCQGWATQ